MMKFSLPVIHVLAVRARVGEALVTLWTLVRLFSTVESPVLHQVMFVLESLVTSVALMRPLV